ncbi:MAG: hypothetical protein M1825_004968 [Sarcosagium campestre]|nr:MAG: hypothetical protein M1825_004968 [Sarcosagium campestre]
MASSSLGSVLVVGGCGFLGHHIVSLLISAGNVSKVSVLDLRTTRNRQPHSAQVAYYDGDITSPESIEPVFAAAKPDVVIHTASPVMVGDISHELMQRVNVEGTRNLLAASASHGVSAFVFTSSASVISDNVADLINADERWPVVPARLQDLYYSETKATAEALVLESNRTNNNKLLTVALRPAGIFGEGDAQMIPGMMGAYTAGRTRVQLGDNDNLFDFTYVGNVAHAHLLAAAALVQTAALLGRDVSPLDNERVDGEAFFITNTTPVYFWDFTRAVWAAAGDTTDPRTDVWTLPRGLGLTLAAAAEWAAKAMGKKPAFVRNQVRYSCMTRYYNTLKAESRLGYKPVVGLSEGVRRSVKWWKEVEAEKEEEQKRGVDKKAQ